MEITVRKILFATALLGSSVCLAVPAKTLSKVEVSQTMKAPYVRVAPKSGNIPFYLEWSTVESATKYQVQSDTDMRFEKPKAFSIKGNRWDSTTTPQKNLTYWFRVRALNGNGVVSPWSDPVTFTM